MKASTLTVEPLDEDSRCVTRNGCYKASGITLDVDAADSMVSIGFVSRSLKRRLHSGAVIGVKDLDNLARQWLRMRGDRAGTDTHTLLRQIEDSAAALRNLI